MRGAFSLAVWYLAFQALQVAEPINPEQLNHEVIVEIVPSRCGWKFCRIFLAEMMALCSKIDDSTVMDVYRRL